LASAAVSLYWTLDGTLLLDTVGGAIEDLARPVRSSGPAARASGEPCCWARASPASIVLIVGHDSRRDDLTSHEDRRHDDLVAEIDVVPHRMSGTAIGALWLTLRLSRFGPLRNSGTAAGPPP
jgi:hypothetical protein